MSALTRSPVRNATTSDNQLLSAMDIVEIENEYIVQTDLPGIKKEDLSVSVKDGVLIIEAETVSENVEKEGDKVIKMERHSGKYKRTLKLGNTIADTKITADYTDGVLKLKLPKSEQEVTRQIDVAVN